MTGTVIVVMIMPADFATAHVTVLKSARWRDVRRPDATRMTERLIVDMGTAADIVTIPACSRSAPV